MVLNGLQVRLQFAELADTFSTQLILLTLDEIEQAARDAGGAGSANASGRSAEPYAAVSSKA